MKRLAPLWPLALVALYLATQNHQYQFDALDYATVAKGGPGWLFHPHHLLYNGFGRLVVTAVRRLVGGDALTILAATNAVATVAAVVVLARIVRRATDDEVLARWVAVAYAVTHGIWYMATSVEVYPIALLGELVALALVSDGERPSNARLAAAALASAIGMLFHQTALFSIPAIMILVAQRRSWLAAFTTAIAAGTLVGATYTVVAYSEGVRSLGAFAHWLTNYAHTQQFSSGAWGGGLRLLTLASGAAGFLATLAYPAFVWQLKGFSPWRPGAVEALPLIPVIAGIALVVGLCIRARRAPARAPLSSDGRTLRRALLVWLVLHAGFTLWWESINFEFWLMLLAPLAILVAQGLARAPQLSRRWAAIGIALVAVGNLAATFIPQTRRSQNGWLVAADALVAAGIHDGDLVLSNEQAIDPYLRYFAGCSARVTSLRATNRDPAAIEKLGADLDKAARRGGAFVLETELLDPDHGLPQPTVDAFYRPRLDHATVIATYPAYGARWKIYRLAN